MAERSERTAQRFKTAKRVLDIVGAVVGLVVFAPVIAAAAVAVRISMGSPVLFRQPRPGLSGRLFTILKFRTMRTTPEHQSDEARLTKVGRILRSTSLDELPQLWNVLCGDMSLVGPRALLVEYLPLYSPRHGRRHDVKPGLTTWNAVNGRNAMTWEEQFEMDIWYIENQSLLLDLKIIAMTVGKVVKREGVTQEGRATRDRFTGLQSERSKRTLSTQSPGRAPRTKVFLTGGGGSGAIAVIHALKELEYDVSTADASLHSAGLGIADRGYVIPFGVDPAFERALREILRSERPDFVVPLVDEEIPILHRLVEHEFPGMRVIAPRLAFCEAMLDKWVMYEKLSAAGISVARSWLASAAADCVYPAVVKPRVGRGSRGLAYLDGPGDLAQYLSKASKDAGQYVVQARAFGAEFTTSAVVALDNTLLAVVPKEVVSKQGITQVGTTRRSASIDSLCRSIQEKLEPRGPFNVQLVLGVDDKPVIFEINPRYSTTVALTLASGVNEVDEVIRRALGKDPISLAFLPDLMMIRYPTQLYVKESEWSPRDLRSPPHE